jgi:hypothetical protein
MRREVFECVGLLDQRLRVLEDWDWMLRISREFSIHVLPDPLTIIHENSPSNPDHTVASTGLFLEKHHDEFLTLGAVHASQVRSQHWENAARNLFRHGRTREACGLLWKSLSSAPFRNPASIAAFPLAFLDSISGSSLLPSVLARRSTLPLRKP